MIVITKDNICMRTSNGIRSTHGVLVTGGRAKLIPTWAADITSSPTAFFANIDTGTNIGTTEVWVYDANVALIIDNS